MSEFRPSWRVRTKRIGVPALASAMAGVLLSCSGEAATTTAPEDEANTLVPIENPPDPTCLWETNELLSRVNAQTPEPIDCGLLLFQQPLDNDCFTNGLEAQEAVQITINNCIDCMIHSTYVFTPGAGLFHLYREADYYGDAVREVRVDSCTDFVAGEGEGANCAGLATRYSCSDPLPDLSEL